MTNETVFGVPVTGDKYETSEPAIQADPILLARAFGGLFAFPFVKAFKWDQYTPYFNDGDPCEFSVNSYSFAIQLAGAEDADPSEDYGLEDGFFNFEDQIEDRYDRTGGWKRRDVPILDETVTNYVPAEHAVAFLEAGRDVVDLLGNGEHEVFLRRSFGDHATVTATREGFSIDYYEHD